MLEYEFVGYATIPDVFSEYVKPTLLSKQMFTPSCFRILIDVTAYGQKVPTQTIELCDAVNCPISNNAVQGKNPLTVIFDILG